jgi:murein DD-endopeptidase MepM/ murein hydrolase activator NlpD
MKSKSRHPILKILLSIFFVLAIVVGYYAYQWYQRSGERTTRLINWLRNPDRSSAWIIQAGERCGEAPFSFPTTGFVGFLWDDSFRPGHRHQGIDIFGGEEPGVTPVYAAYSGYLTRLPSWKSSLIIRIPSDPLKPSRQIWNYYTHLADQDGITYIEPSFPPGTEEIYVEEGTLLGYQGDYSGDPNNPTGVHLHFSIVLDDGAGNFLNELKIQNTLDPSPYFGFTLNAHENQGQVPKCGQN